jgi:hypothetical protein
MNLFNFFGRKKKRLPGKIEDPSPGHQVFCNIATSIFTPFLHEKEFNLIKTEAEEYFTTLIFRKGTRYIKVTASTFPTDYPYSYNIILGEGDSETFPECDWNSIALWRLVKRIDPASDVKEYAFPFGDQVSGSLEQAKDDLAKYGDTFLNGDLALFIEARKFQNQDRESYRVSHVDESGNRQVSHDEVSAELKKRYS